MDTVKCSRPELAAWRDRGHDRYPEPAEPPMQSEARRAYFEGYRGARRADVQGDTLGVSADRNRRPLIG